MAKAETENEQDEDDFVVEEDDTEENEARDVPNSKSNLTKRIQIDNLLEERRLQKQLDDYDFDL